jgi:hypothetical protein
VNGFDAFLGSSQQTIPSSRPRATAAPRTGAVKDGRLATALAARSVLDGTEHGATLQHRVKKRGNRQQPLSGQDGIYVLMHSQRWAPMLDALGGSRGGSFSGERESSKRHARQSNRVEAWLACVGVLEHALRLALLLY